MLDRLATVIWWIGALLLGAGAASTLFTDDMDRRLTSFALFGAAAVVCFTVTYILAGTFRSPPVGPLSKQNG